MLRTSPFTTLAWRPGGAIAFVLMVAFTLPAAHGQTLATGQLVVDLESSTGAGSGGAVGCGDVDGDDHADLVFARRDGFRVYWGPDFMGSGIQSYLPGRLDRAPLEHIYGLGILPGGASAVSVADADGDGRADILIAGRGDAASCGEVRVTLLNAMGQVAAENRILPPGTNPRQWVGSIAVADFDLDGAPEIVLGGYYDPVGDTLHAPPGGACPHPGVRTQGLWQRREIEALEYDKTAGAFSKRRTIAFNSGIWKDENRPTSLPGALMAYGAALAVGDFNGDGYPDLAVGDPGASDRQGSAYLGAFNEQPWHPRPHFPNTCVPQSGMLDIFLGAPEGAGNLTGVLSHYRWLDGWDLEDRCISQFYLTMQAARHASALAFVDLDGDGKDELLVTAPGWRADWGGNTSNAYQGQGTQANPTVDARLGILSYPIRKANCYTTPPVASAGVGTLLRPHGNHPVVEVLQAGGSYQSESVGVALAAGRFGRGGGSSAVLGNPFLGIDPLAPQGTRREGEISVAYDIDISSGVSNASASWYHLLPPERAGRGGFTRFGRWLAAAEVNGSSRSSRDPSPDELVCFAPGLRAPTGRSAEGAAHVLYEGDANGRFGLAPPPGAAIPRFTQSISSGGTGVGLRFSLDPAALSGNVDVIALTLANGHRLASAWPPPCWPGSWITDPVSVFWWQVVLPAAAPTRLLSVWPGGAEHQSAIWNFPWDPVMLGSRFSLFFEVIDVLGGAQGACFAPRLVTSNYLHLTLTR